MRAWLIDEAEHSDGMSLEEIKTPKPGPDEILVDVRAIGVNRADLLQRKGAYPPPAGFDPRRPGLEYAGEVASVGKRVTRHKVGDPVMGLIGGGAYAEKVVVHERDTMRPPAYYDHAQAAAMPEAFLTAYRGLFMEGGLMPGQWALVRGATSGVGTAALQLAHALGARSIATSRSRARLDELAARFKSQGMAQPYDLGLVDEDDGLADTVHEQVGGAHLVLDFVGAKVLADNMACLRDEGRQVQIGVMGGTKAQLDMGVLLMRRLSLIAMTMRSLPLERKIEMARIFDERLRPLFETGRLRPIVDRTFDFEAAIEAQREMETGGHLGKIVLVRD
ncbi:NAD(P)H-quinone oxidoreductase [Salinisphaera sp. Q1T1-3]|uniref:NAD(P)H-quinone oxidoreductase n=1 Tax=Salinisphaera sp. Q1T1-3 TaxID=2321229 RepID=UPI000E76920A|nr:NAD(P)H-quinone oxidoreductase [Salinisphaera sp. Q1T1-3]RJS93753.1 NAD(P)H-quinone oxidoreductase [Salinisphaera sp. Q1T1-3]